VMAASDKYADKTVKAVRGLPAKVTKRKTTHHLLLTEYLLFCLVVVLRAAADYVPGDSGASEGTSAPQGGQSGPLPIWATGTGLFFLLSFPAARGGATAAVANGFGGLIILTLLMRSGSELKTVSGWYETLAGNATATPTQTQLD
jgi:hypothetical protein